ncbi:DNA-3-methyladenine glycosylase [Alphaproteobacteria bacterium LSUCC0684]
MPRVTMQQALMGRDGALLALAREDKEIAAALEQFGPPPDRTLEPGFATLARIIIGQQISTKAAASVWGRMIAAGLDKSAIAAAAPEPILREAGLSGRKAEYIKGLAEAVESGDLDLAALAHMAGEEASRKLTSLRGIGAWTADNYRLFVLLDMDAWPYNDLALQEGMKILKSLNARPGGEMMAEMGKPWKPYRGAGALMLWHVYAQHRHAATVTDIG